MAFDEPLELGKVSNEVIKRSVFPFLPLAGAPAFDGGVISLQGNTVVSHSPSIGVPLEALGFFAFHYAASNVAVRLAKPRHLVVGIYLPLKTRERELRTIVRELGGEASRYGVTVTAGQTATYYGLKIPLLTATCLGTEIRKPEKPGEGDLVYVVGSLGAESVWLKNHSEGIIGEEWRKLTPLPVSLRLQEVGGIRLMHDVSEGGLKKALKEVVEALNIEIKIDSSKIHHAEGVDELGVDVLRAPSYGSMIAISKPDASKEIEEICRKIGVQCNAAGSVGDREGLSVDGEKIERLDRINLDELYGSFR
jgi:hydrogenase maturation factor